MWLEIDNYTGPQLGEIMQKHKIVNPLTGNQLTQPVEFNLMFESNIGPTGQIKGYEARGLAVIQAEVQCSQLSTPRDSPGSFRQLLPTTRIQ